MKELIVRINESDLTPSEKMCLRDYHPVDLVRCKDCSYWKPPHIRLNDGKQRLYRESDKGDVLLNKYVSSDVGINIGGKCWVDHNKGYGRDMRVFRSENDYCSQAIRLPDGMTAAENFHLSTEPSELTDDFDY